MSLLVLCLAYATAGLVLDSIITFHFRCVASGWKYLASLTTFVYITLSFVVLGKILLGDQTLASALSYAFGSAIGSLIATKRR